MKFHPLKFDVNRIPGKPKRRKNVTLVFDEAKRKDFLTGFRKRNLERKKKSQEQLEEKLKIEKKKIKQNCRERYKNLLSSHDIPELQEFLSKSEYETENHTVSILELDVMNLSKNSIGAIKVKYEDESNEKTNAEEESDNDSDTEVPGMELKQKKSKSEQLKSSEFMMMGTKKELKYALKKAALKQMQKSKVFQRKQKLERQKNKKLSKQERLKEERKRIKQEKTMKKRKLVKQDKKRNKRTKNTGNGRKKD